MRFTRTGDFYATSECGRYVINRANLIGGGAYQAVRLGKPWRANHGETTPRGWDGSVTLATERYTDDDEASRIAAYKACVAACEGDANV